MEPATLGRNMASSSTKHGSSHVDMGADSIGEEDLPTFKRLRTSLFDVNDHHDENGRSESVGKKVTDVTKLGGVDRRLFIDKLINHTENDNLRLLQRLKERIDRVNVKLPAVEVRYNNLFVEAECEIVQGKPTLWNTLLSLFSVFKKAIKSKPGEAKINILKDVSGIIKPSRLTLLLGPPGCGKTTLLLAVAGKLDHTLKATGEISYNGYRLDEFVPKKTSAYISQYDLHIPEMTVRETIDYSACCQGVGSRADIMMEVSRKEKEAGIVPDLDVDTYMKAISVEGQKRNLQTDYVSKILGLDICADIAVGSALRRGEMIVGPTKALFMDEISTGLDSSTTFQIVTYLQQMVHITVETALVSLLQPAPETFNLFDDVILMAEGKIVYHGPCSYVLQYFEDCGFKCPERKGIADFLQEVTSKKDQAQYWHRTDIPYSYISKLDEELLKPYDKSQCHSNDLSFSKHSLSKRELFKACMDRELLLMKRNSSVYVFKTVQLLITAFMTMTMFIRTEMELSLTIIRLPVVYKQSSFYPYPAWSYSIPAFLLKIPLSLADALLWTATTYYVIGYSPDVERFFCQFLLLFALHLTSTSMFHFIASIFQTMVVATTTSSFVMVLMFLFGGFIIPRSSLPPWLRWGFWICPMTYGEIGISLNEFLAPCWQKASDGNTTIGRSIITSHALTFLKPSRMSRAIISKKRFSQLQGREDISNKAKLDNESTQAETREVGRMVLPFEPLTMTFKDVQYFVDTTPEMRKHRFNQKKLQLLHDITGIFRPGVLTALMGVSGAGKTTLLDVLCGRKTAGFIEGDIRIRGYPKVQKTFARVSGYCEQHDIHSPQITVEETVKYSAWLRLPVEIDSDTKAKFVEEVIETIELDDIKDSLVGIPGQSGLSTEQRKRLTIAAELVSNPSIIFMDEPSSGLDARAAAIVMRAVKNVVSTGRTTVCTIHQPSIDVFEAFDELILMKTGGRIIYSGMLGHHSSKLIEYFEGISGVPKIKANYNPATWMLEVTFASMEAELELDFANIYKESPLYQDTVGLVRQLSEPQPALVFGILFWKKGREINNEQDMFNILGSIYTAVMFLGINNCSTVLLYVTTERTVTIEIPYVMALAIIYVAITYPTIGYHCSVYKILWYFYVIFCTILYFVYLGMLIVSICPNLQVATISAAAAYPMLNLFSGFLMPGPKIPKWWIWFYWICPTSWSLDGLLTSQYEDLKTVSSFIQDYYGFQHDQLVLVAVVLIAFPVAFASLFAYCIGKLNFQRR
ncbi:hypothetical protein ACOSQ4_007955 [Xanthoceras sorbifolium]